MGDGIHKPVEKVAISKEERELEEILSKGSSYTKEYNKYKDEAKGRGYKYNLCLDNWAKIRIIEDKTPNLLKNETYKKYINFVNNEELKADKRHKDRVDMGVWETESQLLHDQAVANLLTLKFIGAALIAGGMEEEANKIIDDLIKKTKLAEEKINKNDLLKKLLELKGGLTDKEAIEVNKFVEELKKDPELKSINLYNIIGKIYIEHDVHFKNLYIHPFSKTAEFIYHIGILSLPTGQIEMLKGDKVNEKYDYKYYAICSNSSFLDGSLKLHPDKQDLNESGTQFTIEGIRKNYGRTKKQLDQAKRDILSELIKKGVLKVPTGVDPKEIFEIIPVPYTSNIQAREYRLIEFDEKSRKWRQNKEGEVYGRAQDYIGERIGGLEYYLFELKKNYPMAIAVLPILLQAERYCSRSIFFAVEKKGTDFYNILKNTTTGADNIENVLTFWVKKIAADWQLQEEAIKEKKVDELQSSETLKKALRDTRTELSDYTEDVKYKLLRQAVGVGILFFFGKGKLELERVDDRLTSTIELKENIEKLRKELKLPIAARTEKREIEEMSKRLTILYPVIAVGRELKLQMKPKYGGDIDESGKLRTPYRGEIEWSVDWERRIFTHKLENGKLVEGVTLERGYPPLEAITLRRDGGELSTFHPKEKKTERKLELIEFEIDEKRSTEKSLVFLTGINKPGAYSILVEWDGEKKESDSLDVYSKEFKLKCSKTEYNEVNKQLTANFSVELEEQKREESGALRSVFIPIQNVREIPQDFKIIFQPEIGTTKVPLRPFRLLKVGEWMPAGEFRIEFPYGAELGGLNLSDIERCVKTLVETKGWKVSKEGNKLEKKELKGMSLIPPIVPGEPWKLRKGENVEVEIPARINDEFVARFIVPIYDKTRVARISASTSAKDFKEEIGSSDGKIIPPTEMAQAVIPSSTVRTSSIYVPSVGAILSESLKVNYGLTDEEFNEITNTSNKLNELFLPGGRNRMMKNFSEWSGDVDSSTKKIFEYLSTLIDRDLKLDDAEKKKIKNDLGRGEFSEETKELLTNSDLWPAFERIRKIDKKEQPVYSFSLAEIRYEKKPSLLNVLSLDGFLVGTVTKTNNVIITADELQTEMKEGKLITTTKSIFDEQRIRDELTSGMIGVSVGLTIDKKIGTYKVAISEGGKVKLQEFIGESEVLNRMIGELQENKPWYNHILPLLTAIPAGLKVSYSEVEGSKSTLTVSSTVAHLPLSEIIYAFSGGKYYLPAGARIIIPFKIDKEKGAVIDPEGCYQVELAIRKGNWGVRLNTAYDPETKRTIVDGAAFDVLVGSTVFSLGAKRSIIMDLLTEKERSVWSYTFLMTRPWDLDPETLFKKIFGPPPERERLERTEEKIEELRKKIPATENKIKEYQNLKTELETKLQKERNLMTEEDIKESESNLSFYSYNLKRLENRHQRLKKELVESQRLSAALKELVELLNKEATLKYDLATNKEILNSTREAVRSKPLQIRSEIESKKTEIKSWESVVRVFGEHTKEHKDAKVKIVELEGSIKNLEAEIPNVEDECRKAQSEIPGLESQIKGLETELEKIGGDMKEKRKVVDSLLISSEAVENLRKKIPTTENKTKEYQNLKTELETKLQKERNLMTEEDIKESESNLSFYSYNIKRLENKLKKTKEDLEKTEKLYVTSEDRIYNYDLKVAKYLLSLKPGEVSDMLSNPTIKQDTKTGKHGLTSKFAKGIFEKIKDTPNFEITLDEKENFVSIAPKIEKPKEKEESAEEKVVREYFTLYNAVAEGKASFAEFEKKWNEINATITKAKKEDPEFIKRLIDARKKIIGERPLQDLYRELKEK